MRIDLTYPMALVPWLVALSAVFPCLFWGAILSLLAYL